MKPFIAVAAAVAGLARYISDWLQPILPLKLRFAVLTVISPGAMIPSCAPRHGPQPGFRMIPPASTKILKSPSSIALR